MKYIIFLIAFNFFSLNVMIGQKINDYTPSEGFFHNPSISSDKFIRVIKSTKKYKYMKIRSEGRTRHFKLRTNIYDDSPYFVRNYGNDGAFVWSQRIGGPGDTRSYGAIVLGSDYIANIHFSFKRFLGFIGHTLQTVYITIVVKDTSQINTYKVSKYVVLESEFDKWELKHINLNPNNINAQLDEIVSLELKNDSMYIRHNHSFNWKTSKFEPSDSPPYSVSVKGENSIFWNALLKKLELYKE